MKIRSLVFGAAAAGCAMSVAFPPRASAAVSDEDFDKLKNLVQQLNESVQGLKEQHAQDQQTIQQLQQNLGVTQSLATNAVQRAEAAELSATRPMANAGNSATHHIMMGGDAEVQFGKTDGQHSTFVMADFAPIFLYRANDNILFEAGFDVMLHNATNPDGTRAGPGSSTSVSLSFAQLDYLFNDYVTLVAGYDLLPLGTYSERSAGWLNKIPDGPMARNFLPGAGVGVQLRGAVPIGQRGQSLTYAVYAVNGPSSGSVTNGSATSSDLDLGGNVGDTQNWHANPSAGGRIGWFIPFKPHYDLELGLSGQTGQWGDTGSRLWSAAVLDAALHLSPYFEIKGEYINTWYETDDAGTVHPNGVWVQAGYKLAGFNMDMPVINDIELVGRYDNADDGLGTKTDRYTAGFVYYLTNTLLFEADYEFLNGSNPNSLILQMSYGF